MRLTKHHREVIWGRLERRAFAEREKSLREAKLDFADCIYHDLYTVDELNLMATAPNGHYGTRQDVRVTISGTVWELSLRASKPFPYDDASRSYPILKKYEGDHYICKMWERLFEDGEALKLERSRTLAQFNAIFDSVTTDRALLEAWPEIAEVVGVLFNQGANGTKAIVVPGELNKTLGLGGAK